jgi:hypothetical protein
MRPVCLSAGLRRRCMLRCVFPPTTDCFDIKIDGLRHLPASCQELPRAARNRTSCTVRQNKNRTGCHVAYDQHAARTKLTFDGAPWHHLNPIHWAWHIKSRALPQSLVRVENGSSRQLKYDEGNLVRAVLVQLKTSMVERAGHAPLATGTHRTIWHDDDAAGPE